MHPDTVIIEDNSCERYYRIGNADGKYWVVPEKNIKTALGLYQPSGWKGKWLKRILPLLSNVCRSLGSSISAIPGTQKLLRIEDMRCSLSPELTQVLRECFGDDLEFAVFEGTPSVHKKMTIQLSRGDRILGYCKVSASKDVYALFVNECWVLKALRDAGVKCIPEIRYCGHLSGGMGVLVQTTEKTHDSTTIHEWTVIHEGFLRMVEALTTKRMLWDDTDLCKTLTELNRRIDWVPVEYRETVATKIRETTDRHKGKMVDYCACHADFTPWNMLFNANTGIFVFDWEYASLSYPPMIDKCHFLTQCALFEAGLSAKEIYEKVSTQFPENLYSLYLLDIIARYILREGRPTEKAQGVLENALMMLCC